MTKKSKKKAIKTGSKNASRSGLIVSVHLGFDLDNTDSSEEPVERIIKNSPKRKNGRKSAILRTTEDDSMRVSYPFDVWFHISRFLVPEQIKVFSLICRACWKVSHTTRFWLSLYHRFIDCCDTLPFRLQPNNVDSGPGLQARIIRALYFVYPPLTGANKADFTARVINKKCTVVWWEKQYSSKKNCYIWNYFFKVNDINCNDCGKQRDLQVNFEHCKIVIKVKCLNYIHFRQSVLGMVLTSFYSCISSDMRYHQLKMVFHHERRTKCYCKNDGLHLTLNPIMDVNILPWWSPEYPYPSD